MSNTPDHKSLRKLRKLVKFRHAYLSIVRTYRPPAHSPEQMKRLMRRISALNYHYSEDQYELHLKISHRSVPQMSLSAA